VPVSEARIRFDLDLYRQGAVQAAVEAFASFGTIQVAIDGGAAEVTIRDVQSEHADVLRHELANYALFQTAVLARSGK